MADSNGKKKKAKRKAILMGYYNSPRIGGLKGKVSEEVSPPGNTLVQNSQSKDQKEDMNRKDKRKE